MQPGHELRPGNEVCKNRSRWHSVNSSSVEFVYLPLIKHTLCQARGSPEVGIPPTNYVYQGCGTVETRSRVAGKG